MSCFAEPIIAFCEDYGTAWRILRPESLTDQIFIKAQRIRTLETKESKIKEGRYEEYIGIVNYCIMALIQLEYKSTSDIPNKSDKTKDQLRTLYDKYFYNAKKLMMDKNHDYDEVWRSMRISSYTDLILMKIIRTKEIEDNKGKTLISEGIDANYYDMLNYSMFALIRLTEENDI